MVCALAYPDLAKVIGLVGAAAGSVICYIAPAAFALKMAKDRGDKIYQFKYLGHQLMMYGGVAVGLVGTGVAIYEMVTAGKH
jgi:hypothetical protein